ncbi:unnamed protein product, partial [Discosporangium mesarthrocarpum]
ALDTTNQQHCALSQTGLVMSRTYGSGEDGNYLLESWFRDHGGVVEKVRVVDLGGDLSLSMVAVEDIRMGDVVMEIPLSLCMTVDTAVASELKEVLDASPALLDAQDEVLALHLMHEMRKQEASFWVHFIRTLPEDVDTPLRWSEEDRLGLKGTMVGLLSGMMEKQVHKDWEEIHKPLVDRFPHLLGSLCLKDYLWAMHSIWSRAFSYEDKDGISHRAMVPLINAANHHPKAAGSLSEMIGLLDSGEAVTVSGAELSRAGELEQGRGVDKREGKRLVVYAGKDYASEEQFYLLYGHYSNSKLLYSYGFVLKDNPYGRIDFWVRLPQSDPGFAWKRRLLDGHELTKHQAFDFSGTLRAGGWVSPALLATARVCQLTEEERPAALNAFVGMAVTPRNEAAALSSLASQLHRKLSSQGRSLEEELDLIHALECQSLPCPTWKSNIDAKG